MGVKPARFSTIQKNDTSDFISLIGYGNLGIIGKNEEMIGNDVKKYRNLIEQYLGRKKPTIEVTELYNRMGQKLVKVLLFSSNNDTTKIKEIHLSLYFGPPNFISLNKISGYELVTNNSDSLNFRPLSYWNK